MRIVMILLAAQMLILSAGCVSSQNRTQKLYSDKEFVNMTYCMGLADTAMHIASETLNSRPRQQLIDYYAAQPDANVTVAMIHKIYAASFKNAWDYTLSFFDECALNMAAVSSDRVNFANACFRNAMIADVAFAYKKGGYPKSAAYDHFRQFKSKKPMEIIDTVYEGSKTRAGFKMAAWNNCMEEIPEE